MSPRSLTARALAALTLLAAPQLPAQQPADLGAIAKAFLASRASTNWDALDQLPGFKWAPLPPTSLTNCLPNGDCFARQGTATAGGRQLAVMATGARTIVVNVLLRSQGAPLGEAAVMASLKQAGLAPTIARCPVKAGTPATSWYRLTGTDVAPGFLSIQPAAPGRPTEGFVLTRGDELPALQPNQLAMYSEKCEPGAARPAVAAMKPHESIAATVVALLVPTTGAPLPDWTSLRALPVEFTWLDDAPKQVDLSALGDPNPMMLSGTAAWGGRKFSVMATGTAGAVKSIHLSEQGLHPKGEHMLGVVFQKGIQVRKVRCGPVYTESTNDWYTLTSPGTRPANIRQSIRYDGNQVQDTYELRLDGTLPPRDPRDRTPGVSGC